jgi:hypothetical protein
VRILYKDVTAINVYPYPTGQGSKFLVDIRDYEAGTEYIVEIVDISGRRRYHPAAAKQKNVSIQNVFSPGLYILQVSIKQGINTKKIIVE